MVFQRGLCEGWVIAFLLNGVAFETVPVTGTDAAELRLGVCGERGI